MTTDIYEGDLKIIITADGASLEFKGGQPVMDRGIENSVIIDLGTKSKGIESHQNGWIGNYLFNDPAQRIGTDYQDSFENQPITLSGLATREQETKAALTGSIYGKIETEVTNPTSDKVINQIKVNPPAGAFLFQNETFSKLWIFQAIDPASERV
jgi:hypothetical protein